ncbi:MFS transporter [Vagococcus sp. BWB3-3]|uniref:MFS transporter n=1 Tax=Vagococcus allomyrinae TaxID=2794353 RepID=A0A940P6A8_9ENTE|nr:MFS transporter [Vagococcus allomyrinae]MBP1040546.1 MFS transporter [Vagococcus allomyrinae]
MNQQSRSKKQSWLLVLGVLIMAANLRAPLTSISPLVGLIGNDLGLSLGTTGMITTTPLLAFAIFSTIAPMTERRFGMERVIFASLILLASGIFLRSQGSQWTLFTGTIIIGIGIAHCNVLVPSLVKRDFKQNPGLLTGLYSVTMNTFGALASGISLPLVTTFGLTWQSSLRIWGILTILALAIWSPQLKSHSTIKIETGFKEKNNLLTSVLAWKISIFMGLQSLFFYVTIAWLPQILLSKGIGEEVSGVMLAVMQLFLVPTTFVVSIIAGRVKEQVNLTLLGIGILLTGVLGISFFHSVALNFVAVSLIGAGCGFCFSLAMMFFNLRTRTASEAAQLSGMAQSIGYFLASIGPFLFGVMYEKSQSWTSTYVSLIGLCLILLLVGIASAKEGKVS